MESNKVWPTPEEICQRVGEWTKTYRVDMSRLIIIDEAPSEIKKPRWNVSEIFPSRAKIWQERTEILAFLRVIYELNLHGTAVEIGLDEGGTHFIWRHLFERVATIEIDVNKCVRFIATQHPDDRSTIICADSADPKTGNRLRELFGSLDMVFIDGDHQYSSVRCDYNCYAPLIRPGGVIAFHDTLGRHPSHLGVVKFISQLKGGLIDGKKHQVKQIAKGGTGISYEIV